MEAEPVTSATEPQAKKVITVLAGTTDPNYKKEKGLVLHSKGREDYVWKLRSSLGKC